MKIVLLNFLGITGTITDYTKVRFYYDMGDNAGTPVYDKYDKKVMN